MNTYSCKICWQRGKKFSGTRQKVRKHIKEEHRIKGGKVEVNKIPIGVIVNNMIIEEII